MTDYAEREFDKDVLMRELHDKWNVVGDWRSEENNTRRLRCVAIIEQLEKDHDMTDMDVILDELVAFADRRG